MKGLLRAEQQRYLERLAPPARRQQQFVEILGEPASQREIQLTAVVEILARGCVVKDRLTILDIGPGPSLVTCCLADLSADQHLTWIAEDSPVDSAWSERFGERLRILEGEAREVLPSLERRYGFVSVRGDPTEYRRVLDLVLPKMEVNGMVVFDCVLAEGGVAEPPDDLSEVERQRLRALGAFNGYLMIHPQLRSVILPVVGGLGVAVKIQPLITEMGGPF